MTVVAELRFRGVPMDDILKSKIHGRGGLIRTVLCTKPEPDEQPSTPADGAAAAARPKAGPAVGSHAIHVTAADSGDSSSGGLANVPV